MAAALDSQSDSDVSDDWTLLDTNPDGSKSLLRSSFDSGLQSSKEFLLIDTNAEECFELTEIPLSDPLGVIGASQQQLIDDVPAEVLESAQPVYDDDSDGISVILEEEIKGIGLQTAALVETDKETAASTSESMNSAGENANEDMAPAVNDGLRAHNLSPNNNVRMFGFAVLIIVAARQIFIYQDDKERTRLMTAIDNLERLTAASEVLQKRIQESLDVMALNIGLNSRCSQNQPPTATESASIPEIPAVQQYPESLDLYTILPLFQSFAKQHKSTNLLDLSTRIATAFDGILKSERDPKTISDIEKKLFDVIFNIMKTPADAGINVETSENLLKSLVDRVESMAQNGGKLSQSHVNIVQWFDASDDVTDKIFVKEEEKVLPAEKVSNGVKSSSDSIPKNNRQKRDDENNRVPRKFKKQPTQNVRPMKEEHLNVGDKIVKRRGKRDGEPRKKRDVNSKLVWQLERGKEREYIRQDEVKNRYFRSTGMLVS